MLHSSSDGPMGNDMDGQHHVLLATDGSLAAHWPEVWIRGLTWSARPSAEVLTVADVSATLPGWIEQPDDPQVGLLMELLREDHLAEASSISETAAARLRAAGFTSLATTRYGEPAMELLARVRERRPTLVAIGSRGRSDVGPMLLGSVSAQVARYTTAPALIARQAGTSVEALPHRVVLIVDPGTRARAAVEWLDGQGWLHGAQVTLLGLLGSRGPGMGADRGPVEAIMSEAQRNAARVLADLAREIASKALDVSVEVRAGHPLGECRDVAERSQADLVVVTRAGHAPGRYPFAEKVTRYLAVSVLVVPSNGG